MNHINMLKSLRTLSNRMLGKYLIVTNVVTGCGLVMGGDVFNQLVIERFYNKSKTDDQKLVGIDQDRTRRMFYMGFGFGFVNHGWYTFLDKFLPGKTGRIVFKKVVLDQTVAAPMFAFFYLVVSALSEGKNWDQAWTNFKKKILTVYLVDLCFWPAAQTLNFFYIPNNFRVIYVSTCGLLWCIFLSFMHNYDKPSHDEDNNNNIIMDKIKDI